MTDEQVPQERATGRRADRAGTAGQGRRGLVQRRKVDALVVLAVLLPVVVAGALAVTQGDDPAAPPVRPPVRTTLTDASVVCPAAASSTAGDVLVTRVPRMEGGEVTVRVAEPDGPALEEQDPLEVEPEELTTVASDGDVAVTGNGAAAPGLVAGRAGEARAAAECRAPSYDEWFTGLGAAARQSSTIELANPESGPAIVEIALFGPKGLIEEEDLHGIRVAGHEVARFDLSEVSPRRGTLAAHVSVVRGRVVTTVRHTFDALGRSQPRVDFLPAQAAPANEALLLGVPEDGAGTVYLANPGEDEARATVRVVSGDAVFTPAGLEEVVVPPGTLRALPLSRVLTEQAADGALGLQVESTQPLVSSVRLLGDVDLGLVAPVPTIEADVPVTAVVPAGPKRLVLGGALRPGVVRVTAADERGRVVLDGERVEVDADRGLAVDVPDDAVLVTVTASNTPVAGTVQLTGGRIGTLRLRAAEVYAEVPSVSPE